MDQPTLIDDYCDSFKIFRLTRVLLGLQGSSSMTAAELLVVNELANGVRQRYIIFVSRGRGCLIFRQLENLVS